MQNWTDFIEFAHIYYALCYKVHYALVEYGDWTPASEISELDFEWKEPSVVSIDILESYFMYEKKVQKEIAIALSTFDKAKSMALSACLVSVAYNVMYIVRMKQKELRR